MKKLVALFLLLFFGGVIIYTFQSKQITVSNNVSPLVAYQETPTPSSAPVVSGITSKTVFIPYWTFTNTLEASDYDTLIYFGIAPNASGIDTTDPGYLKLKTFVSLAPQNNTTLLAVRMINSDLNSQILRNNSLQQAIIQQSIQAAKDNNFDGIVLDFEISALSFDSVVNGITNFENSFYTQAKQNNLQFAITMYGDTFYRARPFKVATLAQHADAVYIMAYDFSKAGGIDPGPNFPLTGKETYGYDFETMVQDFLKTVPANKLRIVYGMFGYDWTVDPSNKAVQPATSDTLLQANSQFLPRCNLTNCKVFTDPVSDETKVTYTDTNHMHHIVWFENQNSANKKQAYASSNGITGVAYWAYSYF